MGDALRLRAELAHATQCQLGESPLWDDREGLLRWIDGPAGLVHAWAPGAEEVRTLEFGEPVAAIGLCAGGGLLVVHRERLVAFGSERALDPPHADRLNDGAADRQGAYWVGSVSEDRAGHLYRVLPDGEFVVVLSGIGMSNGIDWSPSGEFMYYVDTRSQRVDRLVVDPTSGVVRHRQPFVAVPRSVGLPDGLTVDAEGGVWLAIWGAGQVHRYLPDGSLDCIVDVPASRTCSCAFGGADLRTLYITSARGDEPMSGALFSVRTSVAGRPPHRFAD